MTTRARQQQEQQQFNQANSDTQTKVLNARVHRFIQHYKHYAKHHSEEQKQLAFSRLRISFEQQPIEIQNAIKQAFENI